ADAATQFLGRLGGSVITAGVIISVIGNLSVLLLAAARLPFAMSGNREIPQLFGSVHAKYRTPYIAIFVTAAAMLTMTLSGKFIYAVTISTLARLLTYIATCIGMLILRSRYPARPPRFKAPAGVAVSLGALILMIWLFARSTSVERRDATIAALT